MGKLLTTEEINAKLERRGIKMIGEYAGSHLKVLYACSRGHNWMGVTSNILKGRGCPYCSKRSPKRAEDGLMEVAKKRGFEILGRYTNSKGAILFKCPNGHTFKMAPGHFKSGRGCTICGRAGKMTNDIFVQKIKEKGAFFEPLEKIENNSTKILFRCSNGHIFKTRPAVLLSGCGCEFCSGRRYSEEYVKNRLSEVGIELITKYALSAKKGTFKCKEGHVWSAVISPVLNHRKGCPHCAIHGFKPEMPAFLYIFHLDVKGVGFLGIGITNNFKIREIAHRSTFKRAGIKGTLLHKIYFQNGMEARALEREILMGSDVVNLGIDGFKRESLPISSKDYVLQKIAPYITD